MTYVNFRAFIIIINKERKKGYAFQSVPIFRFLFFAYIAAVLMQKAEYETVSQVMRNWRPRAIQQVQSGGNVDQ